MSVLEGRVAVDWRTLSGEDFLKTRKALGLTQMELARDIGVSHKTLMRWETLPGVMPSLAKVVLALLMTPPAHVPGGVPAAGRIDTPQDEDAPITPQKIRDIRLKRRLTRARMAEILGVSTTTLDKWISGVYAPGGPATICLRLLDEYGPSALTSGIRVREDQVEDAVNDCKGEAV